MKRRFFLTAIITFIVFIGIELFRSGSLLGMDRGHSMGQWSWHGDLGEDGWVNIRNNIGPITVLESSDGQVSVQAKNSWKGNSGPLDFVVNRDGGSLFICAMNSNKPRESDCSKHGYHPGRRSWWQRVFSHEGTPHVAFTVRVPNSANLNLRTVMGDVSVKGPADALIAKTVNGSIGTTYPLHSINAETVNGQIRVKLTGIESSANMKLETVNGSVSAELPSDANVTLRASTVHGSVTSDFPVATSAQPGAQSLHGVLGSGDASLKLVTVNGSVAVRKLPEAGAPAMGQGGMGRGGSASATVDSARAASRGQD